MKYSYLHLFSSALQTRSPHFDAALAQTERENENPLQFFINTGILLNEPGKCITFNSSNLNFCTCESEPVPGADHIKARLRNAYCFLTQLHSACFFLKKQHLLNAKVTNFWIFYLLAIDNFLGEDTILVANAVAVGRHAQRGHAVQETGGQAAQTAVAQPRIGLVLLKVLKI